MIIHRAYLSVNNSPAFSRHYYNARNTCRSFVSLVGFIYGIVVAAPPANKTGGQTRPLLHIILIPDKQRNHKHSFAQKGVAHSLSFVTIIIVLTRLGIMIY